MRCRPDALRTLDVQRAKGKRAFRVYSLLLGFGLCDSPGCEAQDRGVQKVPRKESKGKIVLRLLAFMSRSRGGGVQASVAPQTCVPLSSWPLTLRNYQLVLEETLTPKEQGARVCPDLGLGVKARVSALNSEVSGQVGIRRVTDSVPGGLPSTCNQLEETVRSGLQVLGL